MGTVEVYLHSFFNIGARWGGCSTLRPGRFTPERKPRYPSHKRLGGPHSRCGRVRKMSLPTGIRSLYHPARSQLSMYKYRGADKSLARPTSRVFCLMVRIFLLMLVLFYIYITSTNIPPIMILLVNRIYENQNLLSL